MATKRPASGSFAKIASAEATRSSAWKARDAAARPSRKETPSANSKVGKSRFSKP